MKRDNPVGNNSDDAICRTTHIRYVSLFENMFNGYAYCKLLYDADGKPEDFIYLDVNSAYKKLTGIENPVGKKVTEVLPDFIRRSEAVFNKYCQVAMTGESVQFEIYVEVLECWRIVKAYSPEKDCFAIVFENITDLKTYEYNQMIMAKVFDYVGEAIVVTDANNKIIATNKAFSRLTGYSQEDAIGKDPKILQSGRESYEYYAEMWQTLLSKNYWQGEIWDKRKDGSYYPKLLSISVVRDADGIVTNYVGGFYDITAQKETEQAIERLAYHDTLTNLPNRLSFFERLSQILEHSKRYDDIFAILFIDLDHFKTINDSLGHNVGDLLLCEAANRLKSVIRTSDVVARLGGDEFVIVLTNLEGAFTAAHVADKIVSCFSDSFLLEGHELHSTPSIGISIYPENGVTAEELMKNADTAMYHAKSQGRNNYQYFTRKMHNSALERLSMERDMRLALERDEFFLHYQPQVNIISGRLVGVEALIRWNHPVHGVLPPGSFIPLAEETGLILPIGEWVLKTACKHNKLWQDANLAPLTVAVNLSARQFTQLNIDEVINNALLESGLEHCYLEIEITESLVMHNVEMVMETLDRLKTMGMFLSLDDFGTGYSSLSYLRKFPFDKLKIDQSFVTDIISNPDNAAIARAVIALAHSLRLKVIAEGVETEAQLNYLRSLGCDEIQGYYFSRPIAFEELGKLLESGGGHAVAIAQKSDQAKNILLLDDEINVLSALKRTLLLEGYNVLLAGSAEEAFELLANNHVSVVISDQCMPVMTGIEFFSKIKDIHPNVVRIILTGFADINAVMDAINHGYVFKFLNKPWSNDAVKSALSEAVVYHDFLDKTTRSGA